MKHIKIARLGMYVGIAWLLLQVAAGEVMTPWLSVTAKLLILGALAAITAIFWRHKVLRGIMVFGLTGGLCNVVVIAVNGGYMPAVLWENTMGRFYMSIEGARLWWLADWIWGRVSPGDIMLAIAMVLLALYGLWQLVIRLVCIWFGWVLAGVIRDTFNTMEIMREYRRHVEG